MISPGGLKRGTMRAIPQARRLPDFARCKPRCSLPWSFLLVNIAVLPLVFTGIGALALIVANAYLLSREFFEMIAMRHMAVDEARLLRRENTPRIFAAGFVPAVLSIIPVVNLVVPLFATSYFTHIFKQVRASSP